MTAGARLAQTARHSVTCRCVVCVALDEAAVERAADLRVLMQNLIGGDFVRGWEQRGWSLDELRELVGDAEAGDS